jgi:hypothetical protein
MWKTWDDLPSAAGHMVIELLSTNRSLSKFLGTGLLNKEPYSERNYSRLPGQHRDVPAGIG